MKIKIPDEIFSIQKWNCIVKSNRSVATFIKELIVELPEGQKIDFKSGGYIQIDIPKYKLSYSEFNIEDEYREDWDNYKMWDLVAQNNEDGVFRAYSMARSVSIFPNLMALCTNFSRHRFLMPRQCLPM